MTNETNRPADLPATYAMFLAHPAHVDRERQDDLCRICADQGTTRMTYAEFQASYPDA